MNFMFLMFALNSNFTKMPKGGEKKASHQCVRTDIIIIIICRAQLWAIET